MASVLGKAYSRLYDSLCGLHPWQHVWHFQWLAIKDLRADLRRTLSALHGDILDVGCGDKPYKAWLGSATKYIGIDIAPGTHVDFVIDPERPWPLSDTEFDVILCTQVVEHVGSLDTVLQEIQRVLRPGGTLVVSVPFIYNEHGSPYDFRRLSTHGVRRMFAAGYELIELKGQGGIGSSTGILFLNWLEEMMNSGKATRLLKALLLPIWLLVCVLVNVTGWLLDKIDITEAFYGNVLVVARKQCA